jgi:hypothetical protein
LKRLECAADHWLPSDAYIWNVQIFTFISLYSIIILCLNTRKPFALWLAYNSVVGWGIMLQARRSGFYSQWDNWIFFNFPNPYSCTMAQSLLFL